jgi:hypothetical protein
MSCYLNASIYGPRYQQTLNSSSCTIVSDNFPNATVALATCCNTATNNIVPNSQSNWSSVNTFSSEQFGSYSIISRIVIMRNSSPSPSLHSFCQKRNGVWDPYFVINGWLIKTRAIVTSRVVTHTNYSPTVSRRDSQR